MAWLFGSSTTTAGATGAAVPATAAPTVGGMGAGLTTVGGTGTFGGLGYGGGGLGMQGVGAGTPSLANSLGMGSAPAYGTGTLSTMLAGQSPSLLYGAGSLTAPSTGPTAVAQPATGDIISNLLQGWGLSSPEQPSVAGQGSERRVAPPSLPGQVETMKAKQNQGRMGFNQNGILSWMPQTAQAPQLPPIPGQPQMGPYRG